MTMVAEQVSAPVAARVDVVVGVDTHTDTHTAAVVTSVGAVTASVTVPADAAGYQQLRQWASEHVNGQRVVWAVGRHPQPWCRPVPGTHRRR